MPGEEPLLLPTPHGPNLQWRGIRFYPSEDPTEYARRKARVFSPLQKTLVFVPSVGLGYGLENLLQALPADGAVLCIEAFQEVMGTAISSGLPRDPRLTIVRTDDPTAAAAALRNLGTGRFRRVMELPLSAGYRLAPVVYAGILHALEQELKRYWQNRLTLIALGSLQVRNLISNLPLLARAEDFGTLSTDMPVMLAGAGPSLDATLPTIARLRDRFVLVTVDTALPCFMAGGIHPDIVIALEAQAANLRDFVPGLAPESLLACDLSSFPVAARLAVGRLCFFSSDFAPLSLFDRLAEAGLRPTAIPALGSVGVAGMHAALRLTRAEVYLTGLDFAYSQSRTHARGSPTHVQMLADSTRLFPVGLASYRAMAGRQLIREPAKDGQSVLTDAVLLSYRDSLREQAQQSGGRVFDHGGLGLDLGVRMITAAELEERLGSVIAPKERLRRDSTHRFPAHRLPSFLASERTRLERFVELASGCTTSGATVPDELRGLLHELDYTWIHFPDEPDAGSLDRGFIARVRVAAGYYGQRMARAASIL